MEEIKTKQQKLSAALASYKSLFDNMTKADALLLKLVTHPEATDDQILQVCRMRAAAHQSMDQARYRMQKAIQQLGGVNNLGMRDRMIMERIGLDPYGPILVPREVTKQAPSRWTMQEGQMTLKPENDPSVQALISALDKINDLVQDHELAREISQITEQCKSEVFGEQAKTSSLPSP